MELVVHIGHGKTGSSSIQSTLRTNTENLLEQKTKYLGLNFEHSPFKHYEWQKPAAWNKLLELGTEVAPRELAHVLERTLNTIEKEGYEKAIWSNESLLVSPDIVIPALLAIQKVGVKITVVAYFRRHDAWARSAYLQWAVKHKASPGIVKPFDEWSKRSFDFSNLVNTWLNQNWNKCLIRNFDELNDLVYDFLDCCELDSAEIISVRDNDTPSNVATNLWALYNSQTENPVLPNELYPILSDSKILNKNYLKVDLENLFPTQESLDLVLKNAKPDIDAMNKIFAVGGQPKFSNKELSKKDYTVGWEEMVAGLLDITKAQYEKINNLEQRLNQIERLVNENLANGDSI